MADLKPRPGDVTTLLSFSDNGKDVATATVRVVRGKDVAEATATEDHGDDSGVAKKAAQYGGIWQNRLDRIRAQRNQRAIERATMDAVKQLNEKPAKEAGDSRVR